MSQEKWASQEKYPFKTHLLPMLQILKVKLDWLFHVFHEVIIKLCKQSITIPHTWHTWALRFASVSPPSPAPQGHKACPHSNPNAPPSPPVHFVATKPFHSSRPRPLPQSTSQVPVPKTKCAKALPHNNITSLICVRMYVHFLFVLVSRIRSQEPKSLSTMNRENRLLVTDELVEFEN
jgi:hypothetical protein